jgi:5-methylcytosine-specific restriction endonuclease McrA
MIFLKCFHCGEIKESTFFFKDKQKNTGFKSRCKKCDLLSRDKYARAIYEKSYWDKRRDDRRAMILASHNKNKLKHKEKRLEYLKTESGLASYRKYTQTRYARMKKAFVEYINPIDIYKEQSGICYICKNYFSFQLMELDHIYPIALGGMHERSNVKMACATCNRSKGAKLPKGVCHQMV